MRRFHPAGSAHIRPTSARDDEGELATADEVIDALREAVADLPPEEQEKLREMLHQALQHPDLESWVGATPQYREGEDGGEPPYFPGVPRTGSVTAGGRHATAAVVRPRTARLWLSTAPIRLMRPACRPASRRSPSVTQMSRAFALEEEK